MKQSCRKIINNLYSVIGLFLLTFVLIMSISVQTNAKVDSSLSISTNFPHPGNITAGSGWTLSGTITSNYKLTGVKVVVYKGYVGGTVAISKEVNPSASSAVTSYNVNKLDSYFSFGSLAAGDYYYYVWAKDSTGNTAKQSFYFKVLPKNSTLTISAPYPTTLRKGSGYTITGTVKSNSNINWVRVIVTNAQTGATMAQVTANPNITSYNLNKLDYGIAFGQLPVGRYNYRIDATDNYGGSKYDTHPFTVTSPEPSTFSFSVPPTYPGGSSKTLYCGDGYTLNGVIKGNYNIAEATATVKTVSGSVITSKRLGNNVTASSYDLSILDPYIAFGNLTSGDYYYVVSVTDQNQTTSTVINERFTVKTCESLNWPVSGTSITFYLGGNGFPLYTNTKLSASYTTLNAGSKIKILGYIPNRNLLYVEAGSYKGYVKSNIATNIYAAQSGMRFSTSSGKVLPVYSTRHKNDSYTNCHRLIYNLSASESFYIIQTTTDTIGGTQILYKDGSAYCMGWLDKEEPRPSSNYIPPITIVGCTIGARDRNDALITNVRNISNGKISFDINVPANCSVSWLLYFEGTSSGLNTIDYMSENKAGYVTPTKSGFRDESSSRCGQILQLSGGETTARKYTVTTEVTFFYNYYMILAECYDANGKRISCDEENAPSRVVHDVDMRDGSRFPRVWIDADGKMQTKETNYEGQGFDKTALNMISLVKNTIAFNGSATSYIKLVESVSGTAKAFWGYLVSDGDSWVDNPNSKLTLHTAYNFAILRQPLRAIPNQQPIESGYYLFLNIYHPDSKSVINTVVWSEDNSAILHKWVSYAIPTPVVVP